MPAGVPPIPSASADGQAPLSIALERAALRALALAYDTINANFFVFELQRPVLLASSSTGRLGQWSASERSLEISRELLLTAGWGQVVEVLKHEMAHQYVDEVLGGEATAHGPLFRQVCQKRGFDAQAAGMPSGKTEQRRPGILEKVARLLALAESSNQHEAEAAMNTARKLMLRYNIEEAARPEQRYCYRQLGRPTGRASEAQRCLAVILQEFFFVEVLWVSVWRVMEGRRGSVIEVCGTHENVELADYVHSFLQHTAQRLWEGHKARRAITGNRDRLAYLAGVMAGFREKLASEKHAHHAEGLVWVGDPGARAFMRSRYPHTRRSYHQGAAGSEARAAGRSAGKQVVLHRGLRTEPSAGRPLLLARPG